MTIDLGNIGHEEQAFDSFWEPKQIKYLHKFYIQFLKLS